MPTRDRVDFALKAVSYFRRQDYPALELVIVDDGDEGLAARLPTDARIRYVRSPAPESVGAKRNRACELARGAIIAHWDDDDWHGPARIRAQAGPLVRGEAELSGLASPVVFDRERWEFWSCAAELSERLFLRGILGGTLVYQRRVWTHFARFPNRSLAEDARFLARALRRGCRLTRVPSEGLFLYVRHSSNTWPFRCGPHVEATHWKRVAEPAALRADRGFYSPRSREPPAAVPSRSRSAPVVEWPLVSCIMPTSNRRAYVPHAIRCFLRQEYPNRELIVIDEGTDPVGDLIPTDSRIRYVRLSSSLVLGEKRNLGCELARGALVAHWDDDDWAAPHRLAYQVTELERHAADICGARRELFYDVARRRAWLFEYPVKLRRRLIGNTLCYRREMWARRPFPALAAGEDSWFVRGPQARNAVALADHRFSVAMIHPDNTAAKDTTGPRWEPRPVEEVERLIGADVPLYGRQAFAAGGSGT